MGVLTWIKDKFGKTIEVSPSAFFQLTTEVYIRNLAFQSAISLIANAVSKCEIKTYFENQSVKNKEYYLFNVEPNKNQNASTFTNKLISQLYANNECLVIENKGEIYVADDFDKKEYALFDYQFSSVTVDGYEFGKTFYMSEVLYLKLNNSDIKILLNGMYESYGKLVAYAQNSFNKSRGNRGILKVDSMAQGKPTFQTTFDELMTQRFKTFFENNNAVLPLFEGYHYENLTEKTYANESTRDIKAMIDDIYDFTARAFNIPPTLLKGDLANIGDSVDTFLTFCIDPVCDMIEEEINRKRCGYDGFINGTYTRIDTRTIKHIDLLSISTSIDKLISSGCFCVNDIRKVVGEESIDEPWANKYFMTKNYASVEELLNSMEGRDI